MGEILHGNADLASECGDSAQAEILRSAVQVANQTDTLLGPELQAAAQQHGAVLISIPRPEAPEPLA